MGTALTNDIRLQPEHCKHTNDEGTAANILSYIVLLVGLLSIGACAYMMMVAYSPVPFWDGWIQIQYPAQGVDPFSVKWLWSQYDEHRMPIPKLFLAADLRWMHGKQVLLLTSIFTIQMLQVVVFSWAMRALGGWRGALWRAGTGLAAFCLFCLSQWENLTWGMQVCFLLPNLFASLSFVGLVLYWAKCRSSADRSRSCWLYLLLSISAALGAAWSYANGNLLWPLLLGAAIVLRLRLTAVLGYAVAGALSTALFMYQYVRPAYVIDPARTPLNTLKYFAAFFGSSWVGNSEYARVAEAVGVLGFAVAFAFLLRLRTYIAEGRAFHVQLSLIMVFSLASGLVTSFGRSGFGAAQAFSSRYQSIALLFWCSLGLLLLGTLPASEPQSNIRHSFACATLLLIMLGAARFAGTPLVRARVRGFRLNAGGISLVSGVPDTEQLKWVFWKPSFLNYLASYMRREHISIFDEPISDLLGQALRKRFRMASPEECSGAVESVTEMSAPGNGFRSARITGWAWDNKRAEPAQAVLAVANGTITGIGAMGDWRPFHKAAQPWMSANYLGYNAYVRHLASPVEIYAVLKANPAAACRIDTAALTVPSTTSMP